MFGIITELQNLSQWHMFYRRVCTVEIRFLYDSDITCKKWQDYNSSWVKRLILLPKTKTSVFGNHFLQKCSRGVVGRLVCERKVKLSARAGGELRLVNVSGSAGCVTDGMAPYHWLAQECRSHAYIRPALHAQSN